jgi:hypothetical protein
MTVLNENPEQSVDWVCSISNNLEKGDKVLINDRSNPLRVFHNQLKDGVGAEFPFHQIWLEGNVTTYCLKYSHLCEYHPRLYSASEWTERTDANGEKEVNMHTGSGVDVPFIETTDGGETAIISEQSAAEFIEPTVPEQSGLPDGDTDADALELTGNETVLGDCPDCGSTVVENNDQAVCSDCGLWCWLSQWDAFEQEGQN